MTAPRGRRAPGEAAAVERAADALGRLAGGEGPPLDGATVHPLSGVPGLRIPSVPGHAGTVTLGSSRGLRVAVFAGRCHLYEGATPAEVVRPVRAAARVGARLLAAANAAGGVAEWTRPGDLLVLSDHLDLGRGDPAAGEEDGAFGPLFLSMAGAYDEALAAAAVDAARRERATCAAGVYAFLRGPAFETAAEVRMLRTLGADAVGMSTVPEVLAARRLGMRVFVLSVIANRAGTPGEGHEAVLDRVRSRRAVASRVLDAVLAAFAGDRP